MIIFFKYIINGNIDIVNWLIYEYKVDIKLFLENYENYDNVIITVCERGHLKMLKYVLTLRIGGLSPLKWITYLNAFHKAALYEQLDILKYLVSLCEGKEDCINTMITKQNNSAGGNILLHENYIIADYLFGLNKNTIINDNNIYSCVSRCKIDTLKYIVNLGANLDALIIDLVIRSSENADLKMLDYLLNLNDRSYEDKLSIVMANNSESLERTVRNNNLISTKYLVELFSHNKKEQIKFISVNNNRDVNFAYTHEYNDIVDYLLSVGATLHIDLV